jgi:hypothetical protein
VAGKISGLYVAVTAVGAVLVWSGWKGATIAATLKSLLAGNLNAPDTESAPAPSGAAAAGASGISAAGLGSSSANANYLTIGRYLTANGYSAAAAAGIAGCVAGESSGNPEAAGSGGDGLIGWTPPSTGPALTGNASADLDTQLPAIVAYNNAQGSGLIAMLNAISDPVQAADFYSQHFERPAVTDSDVRPAVATWVYQQLQNLTPATTRTPAEIIAAAVG